MTFIEQANKHAKEYKKTDYFIPSGWNKLHNAIHYVANGVLNGIDSQWSSNIPETIRKELKDILGKKDMNIFGHLPVSVQKRIREAEIQQRPAQSKRIKGRRSRR